MSFQSCISSVSRLGMKSTSEHVPKNVCVRVSMKYRPRTCTHFMVLVHLLISFVTPCSNYISYSCGSQESWWVSLY